VKDEALSRLIPFGEGCVRHALQEYMDHSDHERNHQGNGNVLLFPLSSQRSAGEEPIRYRQRLGGLVKYYECEAA
jgi:putative transposase